MFIKRLEIKNGFDIVRSIEFKLGVNLIVDTSKKVSNTQTGNNVGKTTVLRLIDFCLGAEADIIYRGGENAGEVYQEVAEFLNGREIEIILTLLYDWNNENNSVILIRNFSWEKGKIKCLINGVLYSLTDYRAKLREFFFPELIDKKPSFREIISHNIRYDDTRLDATLKTLHSTTRHDEYDVLNLFLFNSDSSAAEKRIRLKKELDIQKGFKRGLTTEYSLKDLENKLRIQTRLIDETRKKIEGIFVSCDRDKYIRNLNSLRKKRAVLLQVIAEMDFKIRIVEQTISEFRNDIYKENLEAIKALYADAKNVLKEVSVTYESLVLFHNKMNKEKIRFARQELSSCQSIRENKKKELDKVDEEILQLENTIRNTVTVEQMELLVTRLNEAYARKGEYEMCLNQLREVSDRVRQLKEESETVKDEDEAASAERQLDCNIEKFNVLFSEVSRILYNVDNKLIVNKNSNGNYDFSFKLPSMSAGRKQGESLCFDVAYIMYSDSVKKPCLHFMLNDKKELMDANQLEMIPKLLENHPMQLIISMLFDKLPVSIQDKIEEFAVLTLSQNDKLFRF